MIDGWRQKMKHDNKEKKSNNHMNVRKRSESVNQTDKVHTKVTYQYPKKTPFRFPVIPDQEDKREHKTIEEPAYKRKKRVRQNNRLTNQSNKTQKSSMSHDSKSNKTNKPFQPTEVASPIYGFQKRNRMSSEVEKVPAYERREQKKVREENSLLKKTDKVHTQSHAETELPVQEQIVNEDENKDKQIETKAHFEPKHEAQDSEPQNSIHTREKMSHHASISQSRKRQPAKTQREKSKPFNVIMTPRDKHQLRQKKKKFKQNDKQRSVSSKRNHGQNNYKLPYNLLNKPLEVSHEDKVWVKEQQLLLEKTLKHFNVKAHVTHAAQGPSVTRFEVQPELGVKVSRIRNLNDDIKLNMSAKDIRIEAPIPGKNAVGIEIPNLKPQMVGLREIFTTEAFQQSASELSIGLGLDVEGTPLVTDISKMPHGLIAGATGSGKSVCINTILISLMYKSHYKDVKFLLIDPKMVELAPYNDIPHLVSPVITDIKAATAALKWAVEEMESRYDNFVKAGVRDINRYNEKMIQSGQKENKLPFMVIVIDELADLMMISPQDVEDSICRIAQKARACGMHLLLATQRPSVDVITGLIKANIPTRIAFSVSSQVDSRTIIDMNGAERLLGKGDMLFIENGSGQSYRLQGAFVSDEEIEKVTDYARSIAKPEYLFEEKQLLQQAESENEDALLDNVISFILQHNHVSTSLLQRQFRIGYNRAARLIDTLEDRGMISGQNGSKPRDVLVSGRNHEEVH